MLWYEPPSIYPTFVCKKSNTMQNCKPILSSGNAPMEIAITTSLLFSKRVPINIIAASAERSVASSVFLHCIHITLFLVILSTFPIIISTFPIIKQFSYHHEFTTSILCSDYLYLLDYEDRSSLGKSF